MVNRVPIERLRSDVRHLGQILGEVLVEQSGADLLTLVEHVRSKAIANRDGGRPAAPELVEEITRLSLDSMAELVRAFTLYFYLVNAAEENHRLRALRERSEASSGEPRPESIAAAARVLETRGVSGGEINRCLESIRVRPVPTPHPR